MQDKIRRFRHNIYISGFGVVILGFWNVVKTILTMTAGTNLNYNPEDYTATERFFINIFIVLIILVVSGLFFSIHLYIGTNAMKVGKGERRKRRFLVACVILIIISLSNIPSYFVTMAEPATWDTIFAAIFVDLTLVVCLGDILYSNRKIKKLSERKR